ncbi:MAG: ATP-binding protein [Pseudomonadota bacterium]
MPDVMRRNLAELCWLRTALMALFGLTLLYGQLTGLALAAAFPSLLLIFGLLVLINGLTTLRLRQQEPVADDELFLQLLFDLLLLTCLFRVSGGNSNPFVTYYLVPLAIAASTLALRQTLLLAGLMLASYFSLFVWPPAAQAVQWPWQTYQGHLMGMMVNFAISSLLLVFFLHRMHRRLREQERYLAEQQRRQLQRDQAVAMGTLAATAVHELATPLATVCLMVDELEEDMPAQMQPLQGQLQRCRDTLARLREQAAQPSQLPRQALSQHLQNCLQPVQVAFPALNFESGMAAEAAQAVVMPWLLQQALSNVLRNAAEAARSRVRLVAGKRQGEWQCRICDDGAGFPPVLLATLAQPMLSSKPEGLGIGLFLAQSTVSELGGTLTLEASEWGGASVLLRWPDATTLAEAISA